MSYPSEYIDFLVQFHGSRDYFECHEILEDHWKEVDKNNKESIWVSLILLAVSNYHYRRNNLIGAKRTLTKVIARFLSHQKQQQIAMLGMEGQQLITLLKDQLRNMEEAVPYKSLQLPITDELLLQECLHKSVEAGYVWGNNSDMQDVELIHRHSLRDRSAVIKARQTQLYKNNKRY